MKEILKYPWNIEKACTIRWAGKAGRLPMISAQVIKYQENLFIKIWSGPSEETISLVLTACKDEEFTCDDGTCIPMNSRCDRKEDCRVSFCLHNMY